MLEPDFLFPLQILTRLYYSTQCNNIVKIHVKIPSLILSAKNCLKVLQKATINSKTKLKYQNNYSERACPHTLVRHLFQKDSSVLVKKIRENNITLHRFKY